MTSSVLFLVNGLGLGNSTRCHAIIQQLSDQGIRCIVITSGNGVWYFKDCPDVDEVHEIESFYYGAKNEEISIASTLGSVLSFAAIQKRNAQRVAKILDQEKPGLAVLDSMYVTRPFRQRRIPIAALNNSDVIFRAKKFFRELPASVRAQFYAVECSDYFWHRRFPDLVVSPALVPELGRNSLRVKSVRPIVRRGFTPFSSKRDKPKVVTMLSGSAFGSQVTFSERAYPCHIDVIGREAPEGWREHADVRFLGRIRDTLPHLRAADLVVVNGGFSAVSEAYAMAKPVVVVPVPNHAEQWFNGRMIEHLGVGTTSPESEIETNLLSAVDRIDDFRLAYETKFESSDGAEVSANALLKLIR